MNNDPLKHFIKKGDTAPPIRRQIIQASTGLPYDLTGATAKFIMNEEDKTTPIINAAAVIESPEGNGFIRYDWQAGDTDKVGNFPAEFQITLSGGGVLTFPAGEFSPGRSYIYVKITEDLGN
jgi:hypothetical protein